MLGKQIEQNKQNRGERRESVREKDYNVNWDLKRLERDYNYCDKLEPKSLNKPLAKAKAFKLFYKEDPSTIHFVEHDHYRQVPINNVLLITPKFKDLKILKYYLKHVEGANPFIVLYLLKNDFVRLLILLIRRKIFTKDVTRQREIINSLSIHGTFNGRPLPHNGDMRFKDGLFRKIARNFFEIANFYLPASVVNKYRLFQYNSGKAQSQIRQPKDFMGDDKGKEKDDKLDSVSSCSLEEEEEEEEYVSTESGSDSEEQCYDYDSDLDSSSEEEVEGMFETLKQMVSRTFSSIGASLGRGAVRGVTDEVKGKIGKAKKNIAKNIKQMDTEYTNGTIRNLLDFMKWIKEIVKYVVEVILSLLDVTIENIKNMSVKLKVFLIALVSPILTMISSLYKPLSVWFLGMVGFVKLRTSKLKDYNFYKPFSAMMDLFKMSQILPKSVYRRFETIGHYMHDHCSMITGVINILLEKMGLEDYKIKGRIDELKEIILWYQTWMKGKSADVLKKFTDNTDEVPFLCEYISKLSTMKVKDELVPYRQAISNMLRTMQTILSMLPVHAATRIKPLGICWGPHSGIGKSDVLSEMTKMALLHVITADPVLSIKYPNINKGNIAYGTSLDDEYESAYFGQLYDFVDELFISRDDESLSADAKEWISKINTTPRIAVKAEAELKGKIAYEPLLVNATTNFRFESFSNIKVETQALQRRTLYLDATLNNKLDEDEYREFQQSPFMTERLFNMLEDSYTITMIFNERSEHFDKLCKIWKQKFNTTHNKQYVYDRKCRNRGVLRMQLSIKELYQMIVYLIEDNIETYRMRNDIDTNKPTLQELDALLCKPVALGRTVGSGSPQSKMTALLYETRLLNGKFYFLRHEWENYERVFTFPDGTNPRGPKIKQTLDIVFEQISRDFKMKSGDKTWTGEQLLHGIGELTCLLGFEGLPKTIEGLNNFKNWCIKWREMYDFMFKSPVFRAIWLAANKTFEEENSADLQFFNPEIFLGAIQIWHNSNSYRDLSFEYQGLDLLIGYETIPDSELYYWNTTFSINIDKQFIFHVMAIFIGFFLGNVFTSTIRKILNRFGFVEDKTEAEPQSYNRIYNQQQKAARLARSTNLMTSVTEGSPQSLELKEHDHKVLSEFQRAIHPATFHYGEGYFGQAHIFNLFDHVFFAPYHNIRGRELQTIELTYGHEDNRKYIYRASDIKIIYENRDLEICIIKFINGSRLNRGKDLRKHFHDALDSQFESNRCIATLIEKYHKHYIFAESVREYKTDFTLHGLPWKCTGWFSRYGLKTEDSSCGLPYARKYGNKWFINGFQFCLSDNGNSMSTFVSRSLLDKLYEVHQYSPTDTLGKFIPQSKLFKQVEVNLNYKVPVRDTWFPYNYIATSKIKKYETSKTKYVPAIISDSLKIDNLVMPAIMERAYWKLPTGHVTKTDPYKKTKDSLRRVDCPPICDPYKELCREHQDVLHKHQNRGLQRIRHRKLTDREIIQGSKYVNGLRMDTSTGGFGVYNGIKKRKELFDKETGTIINETFRKAVLKQRKYARKGILICYPSMFAKKDETLSIDDVMPMTGAERITYTQYADLIATGAEVYPEELLSKMRLFMMSCIVTLYNLMYVNGVYNSYISHNLWGSMLVAYNPHGFEAEKVWMRLNQSDNVILADHKGLDMSMPSLLLAEQIDYDAKQQGLRPGTEEFIEYVTLLSSVYLSPVEFRGQLFEPFNLHESGHGMTTPYNCNVTNQIVNTAIKCAYPDEDVTHVDRIATGDDLVVMVPDFLAERVNHVTLAGVSLLGFGLTMTTADKQKVTEPFFTGNDYNHVSRTWKEHENGRIVHALKKDSIAGMLHFVSKSLDPVEAIEQNIHAALLEAYKHGEKYYKEIESDIHESLIETGLVIKIPNWDFLNSHFAKRFIPGNVIHGNFKREVFGLDVNYDINTFDFSDITY